MSLIVQDLTKRYGDKVVVDHLSFRMDQPGVYALLGSNGAGKTTSIRMMLGILARDGGTVLWNDRPLNTDTCNVGYLAEERGLYPKYDLMDQLVYFASLRGVDRAEARKRIKYWAERLEVGEYLYPQMTKPAPEQALLGGRKRRPIMARQKIQKPKKADQLSKGNQQKIQLMTALLSDPELLILDEPLSGLDPVNADRSSPSCARRSPAASTSSCRATRCPSWRSSAPTSRFCTAAAPCCRGTSTTSRRAMAA